MIPLVLWGLPESLAFLASRRPADALERINLVLRRLGREPLDHVPEAEPGKNAVRLVDLVKGRLGATSAALWTAFFCVMVSFYFALSWTPQLLVSAGLDPKEGISGGVLLNLGGVVGALVLGLLAARVGSFRIVSATMVAGALAMVVFALLAHGRNLSMALALVVGYFIFGAMVGLYAIMPAVYPTEVRNTGAGLAIGVGRCGAIVSPFLAGVMLEAGWKPSSAYLAFAAPLLVAAVATVVLGRLHNHSEDPA
jgi:MFS family permease